MAKIEYKLTVENCEIRARSKLSAEGVNFPNEDNKTVRGMLHNEFSVSVWIDGKRHSFKYYDSTANYEKGTIELSEEDIKNALDCHFSDALSAADSFPDFCREFGYEEDSRRAEKIYKDCEKSLEKLRAVGLGEDQIRTIADKLRGD